jgi:hypothetical protein
LAQGFPEQQNRTGLGGLGGLCWGVPSMSTTSRRVLRSTVANATIWASLNGLPLARHYPSCRSGKRTRPRLSHLCSSQNRRSFLIRSSRKSSRKAPTDLGVPGRGEVHGSMRMPIPSWAPSRLPDPWQGLGCAKTLSRLRNTPREPVPVARNAERSLPDARRPVAGVTEGK